MNQLFLLIYHICINQLCEDYYEVGNEHSVHGEWKNKFSRKQIQIFENIWL